MNRALAIHRSKQRKVRRGLRSIAAAQADPSSANEILISSASRGSRCERECGRQRAHTDTKVASPLLQKLNRAANWNARGPPEPNSCVNRALGWPNAGLVRSVL